MRSTFFALLTVCLGAGWALAGCGGPAQPVVQLDADGYPLATCVVTNDLLGEGGKAVRVIWYQGQRVKLCCASCEDQFKAEPDRFVAKLREAYRQAGVAVPGEQPASSR